MENTIHKKAKTEPKARLEARVSAEQKHLLAQAAELAGCSLTEFLVSSAREAAYRIIREHQVISLGQRDRRDFVAALLEDAEPGQRLYQAANRYKQRND